MSEDLAAVLLVACVFLFALLAGLVDATFLVLVFPLLALVVLLFLGARGVGPLGGGMAACSAALAAIRELRTAPSFCTLPRSTILTSVAARSQTSQSPIGAMLTLCVSGLQAASCAEEMVSKDEATVLEHIKYCTAAYIAIWCMQQQRQVSVCSHLHLECSAHIPLYC